MLRLLSFVSCSCFICYSNVFGGSWYLARTPYSAAIVCHFLGDFDISLTSPFYRVCLIIVLLFCFWGMECPKYASPGAQILLLRVLMQLTFAYSTNNH